VTGGGNGQRSKRRTIAFISDGKGTRALGQALETSETELKQLRGELVALEASALETCWAARPRSALVPLLVLVRRGILGPGRLQPIRPEVGRPTDQAETALQILDLLDVASQEAGTSEGGSN
jgi:hypothetical protein